MSGYHHFHQRGEWAVDSILGSFHYSVYIDCLRTFSRETFLNSFVVTFRIFIDALLACWLVSLTEMHGHDLLVHSSYHASFTVHPVTAEHSHPPMMIYIPYQTSIFAMQAPSRNPLALSTPSTSHPPLTCNKPLGQRCSGMPISLTLPSHPIHLLLSQLR
jgi:hypothetical protein